ncbi:cell division protein [Actinobacteria bacterium YIM 96077]|uniref:Cell division protein n=2 Tax=Phytoactinopolyspora halophila TaxID=1981511 RepID=A0A329QYS3_9ACTN|nr:cell division protein [Actinobacteria bacterium YIM 96077]RAW17411.1 cell division protein [Phytoactinopolyspora halophila]
MKNRRVRAVDPVVLGAVLVLAGLGALNLITIGASNLALRHVVIVGGGLVVMAVAARLGFARLPLLAWGMYALALAGLLAVLAGDGGARNARRWLDLGITTVQPSELAKVAVVLVLATLLGQGYTRRRFLVALGLAAAPVGLIVLQPDLSTALVLAAMAAFVVILARVPLVPLLPLFGAALAVLPMAVLFLEPYQLGRLQAFVSGERGASGPGWAMLQAEIAVAVGGLSGSADEPLHDLRVEYIPEAQHDLAFASIVHSWGLLAGVAVALAVLALVWRAALISRQAQLSEGALLAGGVAALLGVQTVVSIAANLGLAPHTGLPIPLFSYGGTAATSLLLAFGLVLAARRHTYTRWSLWDPPPERQRRPRFARVGALVLSANLFGLAYFTWHTQDVRSDELRAVSEEQMMRCLRLPAERGVIEDRNGEVLASNADQYDVRVLPGLFPDHNAGAVENLASMVDGSSDDLHDEFAGKGEELDVTVATVGPDAAAELIDADLPGVLVAPSERRDYPHGRLLGPMLGFVGVGTSEDMDRWPDLPLGATVGQAGLERQYDETLRGTDGEQCVYVDPQNRPVAAAGRTDPEPGGDVHLNLDLDLQEVANDAVATAMEESGGDVGAAVLMDARTGAVLAMAGIPAYDNNVYTPPIDRDRLQEEINAPGQPLFHQAIQHAAPPGSTFKLVTAAANAEYEALPPDRVVPTGASYTLGGHTFENWRPMPPQDLVQAIAWSNNVYFYDLAWKLGADRLTTVAQQLGAGERSGIDLPAESAGVLGTPESVEEAGGTWYPGATVVLGIGQGPVVATPLQVARWTAGIATGEMVTPQLAASSGDEEIEPSEPESLSFADRLDPVRDGMRAAGSGGTAALLNELPVDAGGKTGSAENPASPTSEPDSWFTAVAPIDDPDVVATVYVRGGGMGSTTSGPAALEILQAYFEQQ